MWLFLSCLIFVYMKDHEGWYLRLLDDHVLFAIFIFICFFCHVYFALCNQRYNATWPLPSRLRQVGRGLKSYIALWGYVCFRLDEVQYENAFVSFLCFATIKQLLGIWSENISFYSEIVTLFKIQCCSPMIEYHEFSLLAFLLEMSVFG